MSRRSGVETFTRTPPVALEAYLFHQRIPETFSFSEFKVGANSPI